MHAATRRYACAKIQHVNQRTHGTYTAKIQYIHYVSSTFDGRPLPDRSPRRGPVPKLLWGDLLIKSKVKKTVVVSVLSIHENKASRYCHNVRPSVRPCVCLSEMGMLCDRVAYVNVDLTLYLNSSVFCAPWHRSMSTYSQPSFSRSTRKRGVKHD